MSLKTPSTQDESSNSAKYLPPENEKELILAWIRRTRESQLSHYEASNVLTIKGLCLGVPVILISALIGASAFASTITDKIDLWIKLLAGICGIAAAVLSSLQTFFKYPERAEEHRTFGAKWGALRRKLELLYSNITDGVDKLYISQLREEYDRLSSESPDVPSWIFARVQKRQCFPRKFESSH